MVAHLRIEKLREAVKVALIDHFFVKPLDDSLVGGLGSGFSRCVALNLT